MSTISACFNKQRNAANSFRKIKTRINLNADAMYAAIRKDFAEVKDHRASNIKIPLADALMSGFAMFSLKDQSLRSFDQRRMEDPSSLNKVFGIGQIPCDTQMRQILDQVTTDSLRFSFRRIFNWLQRGKAMEKMTWLGGYLLAIDGTGIFSSEKICSDSCLKKNKSNGHVEYHQQILVGSFVHPDSEVVIPTCSEMIIRQDGATKGDCERNAAKRYLDDFRREHPHLQVIVIEDGISSNFPHIAELIRHDMRYILGAKPGDHAFMFEYVAAANKRGETTTFNISDPKRPDVEHCFRFLNNVPLHKSSQDDLRVNFLEYWESDADGNETQHFSWVTDIEITKENAYDIMRGARARWKIENETFNTLKNQGYNLGHNYGLGKKHLSSVFKLLTMLAFLVDQALQMCCPLFKAARAKCTSRKLLWEKIRACFQTFISPSMEAILRWIAQGSTKQPFPALQTE
ncbi:MAG: hypothetical protein Q8O00_07985 [Holophaga sp.]|nr:hypothetical protein [Holophaga sp.]